MAHRSNSIMAELPEPEELDFGALAEGWRSGDIDLFVVLGPTASGKTRFAVRLAHTLMDSFRATPGFEVSGAEIISADSRQVYRGMDIGTGKDLSDYEDIPYHLIDIADPGDGYSVFRFREDFQRAYDDIRSRGAVPILCGGTGLYVNSVLNAYDFREHIPLSSRRLPSGDGSTGAGGHSPSLKVPGDGAAITDYSQAAGLGDLGVGVMAASTDSLAVMVRRPFVIGTLVSREERNARIDARLKARLEAGMVDEIRRLLDSGVPAQTLISYGLEYKFVTLYVLGEMGYDQMYLKLSTAIHQFAKRQMTWFRGMQRSGISIHWVNP